MDKKNVVFTYKNINKWRLKVATRKLTNKQKDKLKNTQFARKNSADLTVNPFFEDDIEYDEDDESVADLYED